MTIATETSAPHPTLSHTGAADSPSIAAAPRQHRVGLGMRLFFTVAMLIAATFSLAAGAATWQANRLASEEIRKTLQPVPDIFGGYVASQGQSRRAVVRSLADEVGTKALLGGGADPATFNDSAVEFAGALGASVVFLFDEHGALLARSDRRPGEEAGRDFSAVSWVRDPLSSGETASSFILEVKRSRRLLLVAAAPVSQGAGGEERLVGLLAAAFELDGAAAQQLGQLMSGEVAILGNVAARAAPFAPAALATSRGLDDAALAGGLASIPHLVATVFGAGRSFGPFEFSSRGTAFLGTAVPMKSGSGEPIAALVVGRSKDAQLAFFRRLRSVVLELGGGVLLLALPVSFGLARRISQPIEQLARAADVVRQGRLDIDLPRARRDEVGTLARAFGAMVTELQEKHQLERLLAALRAAQAAPTGPVPIVSSPDAPQVGELFANRYEVLKLLGEGGMGRIFQARDRELEEVVALKVLAPKLFSERERFGDLLRQEIKVARSITHPNVVRVHDLGEMEGVRFVSMEYVAGISLRQLFAQSGHIELAPGLQIAKQICRGLQAVHAVGIVHSDLKPDNIILMPNGVVKLMDFGVARQRQSAGTMEVLGTPHYMSPEHARGAALDERSDLYSLGVVMFEMFTGRVPFDAGDSREVLRLHLFAVAPSARQVRPDLPEVLADIIRRCLGKSRPERPATAAELERALMRVRD
jgi:serine/threonine-protein kinase